MGARRLAATATALLLSGGVVLAGCGSSERSQPAASGKVSVVASTDVYASLVRAVGGDRVVVDALLDNPSLDPHEYQSTAADAKAVEGAALVVVNGAGYDDFLVKLAATAKAPVLDVVKLSGLPGSETAGQDGAPEFNEHMWFDLPTMRRLVAELLDRLKAVDPAGETTYVQNALTTTAKVDDLLLAVQGARAKVEGKKVAITEPVPLYLLERFGLVNATPESFSEAVEEGDDPSAADLKAELDLLRDKQVSLLAYNAQTETALTKQVADAAKAAGIPEVKVYETLPAGQTDYLPWMAGVIDQIRLGLGA